MSSSKGVPLVPVFYKARYAFLPLISVPEVARGDDGMLHRHKFKIDGEEHLSTKKTKAEEQEGRICQSVKDIIDPRILSDKDVKSICSKNNIPLGWVTDRFAQKPKPKTIREDSGRREVRKSAGLSLEQYRKFRDQLRKIDRQTAIIAEVLWFLNRQIGRDGTFVTLEELLHLKLQDLSSEEEGTKVITLYRCNPYQTHLIGHYLPDHLWRRMCEQIGNMTVFVFSTSTGGPVPSSHITKQFKKASKVAQTKNLVTSLSLRPFAHVRKRRKRWIEVPKEVSLDNWKKLLEKIPSLTRVKGRPPKHDPRETKRNFISSANQGSH